MLSDVSQAHKDQYYYSWDARDQTRKERLGRWGVSHWGTESESGWRSKLQRSVLCGGHRGSECTLQNC